MYIIDPTMRTNFILGLRPRYARLLPNKLIRNRIDISFAATNLYVSGTPFFNYNNAARGLVRQARMTSAADVERTLIPFVDKVWKYFNQHPNTNNSQANFDRFHEELCDLFLSSFAIAGYVHTYGNAQKMVNMLFKYLTCFADYSTFADLFNYCHIPIDGKILGGFYLAYRVPNTKGTRTSGTYSGVRWTRMDKATYLALCNDYRATLAPIKGSHSWLGMEYYIWAGAAIPSTGVHASSVAKFYM